MIDYYDGKSEMIPVENAREAPISAIMAETFKAMFKVEQSLKEILSRIVGATADNEKEPEPKCLMDSVVFSREASLKCIELTERLKSMV